jgi:hypothetical protein
MNNFKLPITKQMPQTNHLIRSRSTKLSSIICLTNVTSPPGKTLSCGLAVLLERCSGRLSVRVFVIPHASILVPKNGGLHMQKSNVPSDSVITSDKIAVSTTRLTVVSKYLIKQDTVYNLKIEKKVIIIITKPTKLTFNTIL